MAKTFKTATAFRQALEQRLKTTAEARGVPLNTLRLKLTIERLLARLFASADAPWLLKGGYAMELRYRPNARTTKDIDLSVPAPQAAGHHKERMDRIRDQLQAAADAEKVDYFQFLIGAQQAELQGAPQGGARFPIEARLAGRLFGRFHVDVGIGDAVHGSSERLTGDDLLAFAGVAPAQALAIPKAQQFAEKLHAYTFPWTDRTNTRTRDLVDMLLMLERSSPDASDIQTAVEATFQTRHTHPIPEILPAPPQSWAADFSVMADEAGLSTRDLAVYETLLDMARA